MADLEIRSAQLGEVRFADRIIELVVMPYETEADVPYAGRRIREMVSRGAFGKIDPTKRRITVNRDHDLNRSIGKAVAIIDDADALRAELKISPTQLGDETLQLADDGVLDASAGMRLMPGGETWHENRTLRRLTKLWLHHIALVPDPAYDGARVLAVRAAAVTVSQAGPTPNLDLVRSWRLSAEFASLDRE